MRKLLLSACAVILSATIAHADGDFDKRLTPFDKQRLANFDATLKDAMSEARAGATKADLAVIDAALSGTPMPLAQGYDPTGNWRCRTIKVGGGLPLVVYGWFKCRISDDGAGWKLDKLTGSQRTQGYFYTLSDTRLAYLGAGYVVGEKPRRYGDDPREDQVAFVERRATNRIVLLFPAPQYESKLDVLVLER